MAISPTTISINNRVREFFKQEGEIERLAKQNAFDITRTANKDISSLLNDAKRGRVDIQSAIDQINQLAQQAPTDITAAGQSGTAQGKSFLGDTLKALRRLHAKEHRTVQGLSWLPDKGGAATGVVCTRTCARCAECGAKGDSAAPAAAGAIVIRRFGLVCPVVSCSARRA